MYSNEDLKNSLMENLFYLIYYEKLIKDKKNTDICIKESKERLNELNEIIAEFFLE